MACSPARLHPADNTTYMQQMITNKPLLYILTHHCRYVLGQGSGRFWQDLSSILHGLKINVDNSSSVCCIYTVSTALRHQRNYAWVWEQRTRNIPRWYQLHYSRSAQCVHLAVLYHCRNTRITASSQRQLISLILPSFVFSSVLDCKPEDWSSVDGCCIQAVYTQQLPGSL